MKASTLNDQRFGIVFSLMQILALPLLFAMRSPRAKLGAAGLGNRGESRLELFIPDGTPPHITFRFIEPAVWICYGIVFAWRIDWSLWILAIFTVTGIALHLVEQTYYEASLAPCATGKEPTGAKAPVEDRLAKLADLLRQNLITQTEYEAKKQLILNDL